MRLVVSGLVLALVAASLGAGGVAATSEVEVRNVNLDLEQGPLRTDLLWCLELGCGPSSNPVAVLTRCLYQDDRPWAEWFVVCRDAHQAMRCARAAEAAVACAQAMVGQGSESMPDAPPAVVQDAMNTVASTVADVLVEIQFLSCDCDALGIMRVTGVVNAVVRQVILTQEFADGEAAAMAQAVAAGAQEGDMVAVSSVVLGGAARACERGETLSETSRDAAWASATWTLDDMDRTRPLYRGTMAAVVAMFGSGGDSLVPRCDVVHVMVSMVAAVVVLSSGKVDDIHAVGRGAPQEVPPRVKDTTDKLEGLVTSVLFTKESLQGVLAATLSDLPGPPEAASQASARVVRGVGDVVAMDGSFSLEFTSLVNVVVWNVIFTKEEGGRISSGAVQDAPGAVGALPDATPASDVAAATGQEAAGLVITVALKWQQATARWLNAVIGP